jgi:hypothetical protein
MLDAPSTATPDDPITGIVLILTISLIPIGGVATFAYLVIRVQEL